jgi:hypothetical protein
MKGLKSITSWRTFLVGVLVGYIFAWGIHWASQLYGLDHRWHDENIPYLTPSFGRGGEIK